MLLTQPEIIVPDFDEETHTYRVDGRVVIGVTDTLKYGPWKGANETESGWVVSDEVMENAADRGKVIHAAIALLNEGRLDWDSVDDECLAYVEAYSDWMHDVGYVPLASEEIGYCESKDYCYTRDGRGLIGERQVVVDIKTGSAGLKPWHKNQLAAYAYPLATEDNEGVLQWPDRIMLHLKPNGKAKPYHFSVKSAAWDFEVFMACRTLATAAVLDRAA